MPRFAANISHLFSERPLLGRMQAAADAGFEAVEILFPYDGPAKEIRSALAASGLELVLINAPPPNYTGGDPGYAAVPEHEDRFRADMARVMRYAELLKPEKIHIMSGYQTGSAAFRTFVQNLTWVARRYPDQSFTIEPLNPVAQPGYFLNDYALAADVLRAVGQPNVGLQYDSYHAQMIHGDALRVWERHKDLVQHVQIGASPNRSEPDRGVIDFPLLFSLIDQSGYSGWVSAEYTPSRRKTEATLGWMQWQA